jgi:aryl carrier-like protein
MMQVLGVPRTTVDDNFFALGGDSILAFQLVSRARQAGLILSLRDVFEQPTIEALAGISRAQDVAAAVPDVGEPNATATPIMCWFLNPGGTLNLQPVCAASPGQSGAPASCERFADDT